MTFKRLLLLGFLLILFLSMYTWNRQSSILDRISTDLGLELVGTILRPVKNFESFVLRIWNRYINLIDVERKNEELAIYIKELEAKLLSSKEDLAELKRLRELLQLPVDDTWTPVGARVLAGHLGPNSILDSITINRGYTTGARPGTPIATHKGLVGRVLRASPHTGTAMLLTNPGSKISIFAQKSRNSGILIGEGAGRNLSVRYMQKSSTIKEGELLITSGLDSKFPKGIPVARIVSIKAANDADFMQIEAEPLVDFFHLEEVLLLEHTDGGNLSPSLKTTTHSNLIPKDLNFLSSKRQLGTKLSPAR